MFHPIFQRYFNKMVQIEEPKTEIETLGTKITIRYLKTFNATIKILV
jgi:hypothetical protein